MALKKGGAGGSVCSGVLIAACGESIAQGLGMQCHRYTLDDFDGPSNKLQQNVRHAGELEIKAETDFCIDAAHMGVGGVNSWGEKPMPQHMLKADQALRWSFGLR